mgnify:CR=1 FL=1
MRRQASPRTARFGRHIRDLRKNEDNSKAHKGMSRPEFVRKATELGEPVSIDWITAIELGQRQDLTLGDLMTLSRTLERPLAAILCDLKQPFEESFLPMFKGKTNIEVLNECFGALSDGLESYATLGSVVYNARKVELSMQVCNDALRILSDYEGPETPESPSAEGYVSSEAFNDSLEKACAQEQFDVLNGYIPEISSLRKALKADGVHFPDRPGPFQNLCDERFNGMMLAVKNQSTKQLKRLSDIRIIAPMPPVPSSIG